MHIASILLNAVVAVSNLSHMPCFVQTAFVEWVCTVTYHDKWNVPWQVKRISASDCALWHYLFLSLCSTRCCVLRLRGEMCSKECCLFGCDSVLVGRNLPTHVRNVLLHLQYSNLSMGAVGFFKIFITLYQTTYCHIPQGCVLQNYSLKNLAWWYYLL